MKIEYSLSSHSYHTEAVCDKGFEAFRDCILMVTRRTSILYYPIMWVLTRFYKKKVVRGEKCTISYDLFLIPLN